MIVSPIPARLAVIAGGIALVLGSLAFTQHVPSIGPVHATKSAQQPRGLARTVDISHHFEYGTGLGQFELLDNGCTSFVVSGPAAAQPVTVATDDPRLQPCTPTVNSFTVHWLSRPTQAQDQAMARSLGNLAIHNPTVTLAVAAPLIHAAVDNAQ